MIRHRTLAGLATLLLVAVVGCSSTTSRSGGATDSAVDSTVDTTGTDTGDSVDDGTALPTTSSTTPAADALLLRSDGIGAHDLGDDVESVYNDMEALLGFPATDLTDEYTVPEGVGVYQSADGQMQFIAPFSRTVCWSNSLCLVFGGGTAESMSFTGWRYDNDPAASLASEAEASLGTSWADLPGMSVSEGGCYTVGYGEVDGIQVVLMSSGVPFTEVDSAGNYVNNTPDPADVTILSMETGELPIALYGDC